MENLKGEGMRHKSYKGGMENNGTGTIGSDGSKNDRIEEGNYRPLRKSHGKLVCRILLKYIHMSIFVHKYTHTKNYRILPNSKKTMFPLDTMDHQLKRLFPGVGYSFWSC